MPLVNFEGVQVGDKFRFNLNGCPFGICLGDGDIVEVISLESRTYYENTYSLSTVDVTCTGLVQTVPAQCLTRIEEYKTPCQQMGLSEGDTVVDTRTGKFWVLKCDDGSSCPSFIRDGDINYLTLEFVKPIKEGEVLMKTIPETKHPTAYAKHFYAISKQLGHSGWELPYEDAVYFTPDAEVNNILNMVEYKKEVNEVYAMRRLRNFYAEEYIANSVCDFIAKQFPWEHISTDYRYGLAIAKTIGYSVKFDYEKKGIQILNEDRNLTLTIKAFGRKFGFSKLPEWSIIAEKLKQEVDKDVKIEYFTEYKDLRKYYTMEEVSGESCMRYAFSNLDYHPCIAYAHDVLDHAEDADKYVSEGIKLAVLFTNGEPIARCMVNTDSKTRGKAFGSGASTLTKMLGFEDDGITGYVNIVRTSAGIIMPYIDGASCVYEGDGEIGEGDLNCEETDGLGNNIGIWSEHHETYIDEDVAVWSDSLDSYVDPDDDEIVHSKYAGDWYQIDNVYYLDFKGDYIHEDDVEEVCMEHIEYNANISELIEFCNNI